MTATLLGLNAIGGIFLAITLMLGIRVINSYSYRYSHKAVIIDNGFSENHFNYKVEFEVNGKPEIRDLSILINLNKTENNRIIAQESFLNIYKKGKSITIVSKDKEATNGVKKEDYPIRSFIFFLFMTIAFHSTAYYLTGGSLFFSV